MKWCSKTTRVASAAGVIRFARRFGIDFFSRVPNQGFIFHAPSGRSTTPPIELPTDVLDAVSEHATFLDYRKG